jgi:deazaflavin-dependent oxidoreductase (nitroreductase family)
MSADEAVGAGQAQKLAAQGLVNRIVRGLLRAPLLGRVVGRRLVTLYVVGRKTGRRYTVPIAYTRHDGTLLTGTQAGWGRNLRTGEPITIRFRGRRQPADVQVLIDEAEVVDAYSTMARDNHNFAKFNQIRFDAAGNPERDDLHQAWLAGSRAFRLTPR